MRRVGLLSALAVSCLSSALFGQTAQSQPARIADGNLDIAVHWAKGDLFHLEVDKKLSQTGRPTAGVRSQADMEVLETGVAGHLVAWTIRKTEFLDANGQPLKLDDPATNLLWEAFNNVSAEVELSPGFAVIGIRNIEKLRPAIDKGIDAIVSRGQATEAEKSKLKATLEKVTLTDEFIVHAFSKEIGIYLRICGKTLPLEGAMEGESEQPMPIGGGLVTFKSRVKVDSLDKARGLATVTGEQRPDPQALSAALAKLFKEVEAAGGAPAPGEMPKPEAKDDFRYVMDLKTGLPKSAEFNRSFKVEKAVRQESTRITLKSLAPASRPTNGG